MHLKLKIHYYHNIQIKINLSVFNQPLKNIVHKKIHLFVFYI